MNSDLGRMCALRWSPSQYVEIHWSLNPAHTHRGEGERERGRGRGREGEGEGEREKGRGNLDFDSIYRRPNTAHFLNQSALETHY